MCRLWLNWPVARPILYRIYPSGFVLSIFWPSALNLVTSPILLPSTENNDSSVYCNSSFPAGHSWVYVFPNETYNPHLAHSWFKMSRVFSASSGPTLLGHPQIKAPWPFPFRVIFYFWLSADFAFFTAFWDQKLIDVIPKTDSSRCNFFFNSMFHDFQDPVEIPYKDRRRFPRAPPKTSNQISLLLILARVFR